MWGNGDERLERSKIDQEIGAELASKDYPITQVIELLDGLYADVRRSLVAQLKETTQQTIRIQAIPGVEE